MCKHWGKITYYGEDLSSDKYEWLKRVNCSKCCIFFKTKNGKNYRSHSPYQRACEHFEEKEDKTMTREEAKELLPIMQAFAEGKTIQLLDGGKWLDVYETDFHESPVKYRIKPEPRYRPFKTKEECWNEMLKHQPFGWVKDEYKYVHIECVLKNEIEFSPDEDDDGTLLTCTIDFTSVCEQGYTFADGTPF